MNHFALPIRRSYLVGGLVLLVALMSLERACAQPTIVTTDPPSGASGVPVSTAVVLTFSEAMNTSVTLAYLFDSSTLELLPASLSWSAGNTVLTCTPTAAFPAGRTIWWTVMNGQNTAGTPLSGYTGGSFTAASPIQLTLTNAIWSGGMFAFDVTSQPSQTLTVEYSSTLLPNQWQTLLTTNSPTGRVHIVDPRSSANRSIF